MTRNKQIQIIAEIASNWNGNEKLGKKIIKDVVSAGSNFIKFQMWRATDLYKQSHPYWNQIKKSELTPTLAKQFKEFSDRLGIDFFCSVFYPEAVDVMEELKVPLYKIASRTSALMDFNSLDTMLKIAETKKPVIISMGFGGNKKKLGDIFKHNKKYFLYRVSKYPAPIDEIDFKNIISYDGFSDHTEGYLAPLIYTIKTNKQQKLRFIEKHVRIEKSTGPDKAFSMDVRDFAKLVQNIRTLESIVI